MTRALRKQVLRSGARRYRWRFARKGGACRGRKARAGTGTGRWGRAQPQVDETPRARSPVWGAAAVCPFRFRPVPPDRTRLGRPPWCPGIRVPPFRLSACSTWFERFFFLFLYSNPQTVCAQNVCRTRALVHCLLAPLVLARVTSDTGGDDLESASRSSYASADTNDTTRERAPPTTGHSIRQMITLYARQWRLFGLFGGYLRCR